VRRLVLIALLALAAAPLAHAGVTQGKALYGEYCVACHGANGMGANGGETGFGPGRSEEVQKRLGPPLIGVGALAADFYLRTGYMPLRESGKQPRRSRLLLSNPQIRALVAYVASLGKGPKVPTPRPERGSLSNGQRLFTDHCAGCHQVVAEGGYLTGGVAPPLEEATSTQIAEAIRIGPYIMPRFSTHDLSPQDVNSIVRYVDWAKHPDDRGGWAIGHLGPVPEGLVTWFLAATTLVAICVLLGKRLRHE
jgi:ubiquinol-cytochrome c reductase cytochrome c subunit